MHRATLAGLEPAIFSCEPVSPRALESRLMLCPCGHKAYACIIDANSGEAQYLACWAHYPKVCASKTRSAIPCVLKRISQALPRRRAQQLEQPSVGCEWHPQQNTSKQRNVCAAVPKPRVARKLPRCELRQLARYEIIPVRPYLGVGAPRKAA